MASNWFLLPTSFALSSLKIAITKDDDANENGDEIRKYTSCLQWYNSMNGWWMFEQSVQFEFSFNFCWTEPWKRSRIQREDEEMTGNEEEGWKEKERKWERLVIAVTREKEDWAIHQRELQEGNKWSTNNRPSLWTFFNLPSLLLRFVYSSTHHFLYSITWLPTFLWTNEWW